MSTRVDILAAKGDFEDHVAEHKCRAQYSTVPAQPRCDKRIELWQRYMRVAGAWGLDATDADRLRELYGWQDRILNEHADPARYASMRRAA